jgi:hypothetical protein
MISIPSPNQLRDLPSLLFNACRDSFPETNGQWLEFDHSPTSSSEVTNGWRYTSSPRVRLHSDFPFTDIIPTYLFCDSYSAPLQHELIRNISYFANLWPGPLVTNIHWRNYRWHKLIFQRLVPCLRHSAYKYQSNENTKGNFLPCFYTNSFPMMW